MMPAEWAPHRATWLTWPEHPKHWKRLEPVRRVYDRMIEAITEGEWVHLLVRNAAGEIAVRARYRCRSRMLSRIRFFHIPTHDVWVRDYGPTFVVRAGRLGAVRWVFNAWGGKYADIAADGRAGQRIAARRKARVVRSLLTAEGGAIESDGDGNLMTTEQCLLNPNRNPGWTRRRVEKALCGALGARGVLWLPGGIAGDDTDGHIDEVARFVAPRTILACETDDSKNPNYTTLRRNLAAIRASADARGRCWSIVPLPLPRLPGRRAASYANFYISNKAVLVPQFGAREDREAARVIGSLFKNRRTALIPCRPLIEGLGGIHCVTQQEPRTKEER